jgi:hypothetical protein
MKKVALTLASVLAAAAFAPEASALPAFARQTGMACNACHQTHFPVLNGFGRAFKAGGYTMMGAQEKVEGEHLSIPAVMNTAILFKYRYQQFSGGTKTVGAGKTAATNENDGMFQMGDEASLFFGGRVAETELFNIGFLAENNLVQGGAGMPLLAGLRVPVTADLGAAKVSVVPFTTDGLGAAYGFELSSGGVMRANRWAELRRESSAVQYMADRGPGGGAASGTAFVLHNDMGYINVTKWSSSLAPGANGGAVPSTNFGQNFIRVAATPSIAGFDFVVGGGMESGKSFANLGNTETESKLTFVDLQAQGDIAGMMSGVYAQYATAPACAVNGACEHNSNSLDRKAFTVGGELMVIPHTLTLKASYRNAKNGAPDAVGSKTSQTDNAVLIGAVYDLVQNVALVAEYASYSGTAKKPQSTDTGVTSQFLGMLEMAW